MGAGAGGGGLARRALAVRPAPGQHHQERHGGARRRRRHPGHRHGQDHRRRAHQFAAGLRRQAGHGDHHQHHRQAGRGAGPGADRGRRGSSRTERHASTFGVELQAAPSPRSSGDFTGHRRDQPGQDHQPERLLHSRRAPTARSASPRASPTWPGSATTWTWRSRRWPATAVPRSSSGRASSPPTPRKPASSSGRPGPTSPATAAGGGYYGNYSQYQQLQIGINLSILPFINSEGLVVMDIRQRIQGIGRLGDHQRQRCAHHQRQGGHRLHRGARPRHRHAGRLHRLGHHQHPRGRALAEGHPAAGRALQDPQSNNAAPKWSSWSGPPS